MIQFFIDGPPCGQPRQRVGVLHGHARTFTPKTRKRADGTRVELPIWAWKAAIASASAPFLPKRAFRGALWVGLTFYFPRPKDHFRKVKKSECKCFDKDLCFCAPIKKDDAPIFYTPKPDRDNCDKAVLDVLTEKPKLGIRGFWVDDSLIVDGFVRKYYANAGKVGCHVQIARPEKPAGLVMMEV